MLLQFKIYFDIFNNIYYWDGKAEFAASLLQSSLFSVMWSFRNHSNMLLWCFMANFL